MTGKQDKEKVRQKAVLNRRFSNYEDPNAGFNQQSLLEVSTKEYSNFVAKNEEKIKTKQCRLLKKNGRYNIHFKHISNKNNVYISDIYSTFVELPWIAVTLIYSLVFIISWIAFACIWFAISYIRNDFDPKNLTDPTYEPCVQNGIDFSSMVLFSLETQTTIGYGSRHPTTNCPEGTILLMLQTCFGTAIQAFMTGFIFAKLTRPKKRTASVLFSNIAVIGQRDGKRVLMFRIADTMQSHMIACNISAVLIKNRITKEGEILNLEQHDVSFGLEEGKSHGLLLAWPMTICHVIDKSSPFYMISKNNLKHIHFELIILLEGTSQLTSQTVQTRHSYLPSEILWGHRFKRMIFYQKNKEKYHLNCSTFNDVIPIADFPEASVHVQQNYGKSKEYCETGNGVSDLEDDDNKDSDLEETDNVLISHLNTDQDSMA